MWALLLQTSPSVCLSLGQRGRCFCGTMLPTISIPNTSPRDAPRWRRLPYRFIQIPDGAALQNNSKAHRAFSWLYKLFWFPVRRQGLRTKAHCCLLSKLSLLLSCELLSVWTVKTWKGEPMSKGILQAKHWRAVQNKIRLGTIFHFSFLTFPMWAALIHSLHSFNICGRVSACWKKKTLESSVVQFGCRMRLS